MTNDLDNYKRASFDLELPMGETTLPAARFYKALKNMPVHMEERVTRTQIFEELYIRRGLDVRQAMRLLEYLLQTDAQVARMQEYVGAPAYLTDSYALTFEYKKQLIKIEGLSINALLVDGFYWYWNERFAIGEPDA